MSALIGFAPVAGEEWREERLLAAWDRRSALTRGGCSTYALGVPGLGHRILCLCCGMASGNPNDIQALYCGFCHAYHSDKWIRSDHAARH